MLPRDYAEITYTFVDHENQKATHSVHVSFNAEVTNPLVAARSWAAAYLAAIYNTGDDYQPAVGDLSQCACLGYVVKFATIQDGVTDLTALAGDSEDKSLILYRNATGFPLQGAIPGCVDDLQVEDGTKILPDLDMAQFAALTTLIIDGEGQGGDPQAYTYGCDSRGERVATIVEGYKQQRGSTKRSGRRG